MTSHASSLPEVAPPTFSILVAAYSTGPVIADMIASVQAQTRSDWELIIVDDGSPDDLARYVNPYLVDARIRLERLPRSGGAAAARNHAASLARGRYFSVVDSDDMVEPTFLAAAGDAMTTVPAPGLVGSNVARIDVRGRPLPDEGAPPALPPAGDPESVLLALLRGPFGFHGATFDRDAFVEIGGYDTMLWMAEDMDIWTRVAATGRRVLVLPERLYRYRVHDASITNASDAVTRGTAHLQALDRLEFKLATTDARRRALGRHRRRVLAGMALAENRAAQNEGRAKDTIRAAMRHLRLAPSAYAAGVLVVSLLPPTLGRIVRRGRSPKDSASLRSS